jgi:stress-induced morphogen
MIEPSELRRLLQVAFPGATVEITDLTGTRDHYSVSVVAEAFRGRTRVQQHKLVYAALGELMRGPIHALGLETSAPA